MAAVERLSTSVNFCSTSSACAAASACASEGCAALPREAGGTTSRDCVADWAFFLALLEAGFFGGWLAEFELVAGAVEAVASLAGAEDVLEASGDDCPACGVCAPDGVAAAPVALVGVAEEVSGGMGVADVGVAVESPGAEGVVDAGDAGVDADESAGCDCCAGAAFLPAPARVFK